MSQLPHVSFESMQAHFGAAPDSRLFAPLALAYRQQGQLPEAVRLLRAGLERHPHYVAAWVLLGICQRELQQDEEAEAAFARVLELDPENLVALRFRAERARRRGAIERAVELLRRALEIDPFDREVQADLGLLSAAVERKLQAERGAAEPPPAPEARPWAIEPRPSPAAAAPPPSAPPEPRPEPARPRMPGEVPPPSIDLRRVGQAPETPPFVLPGSKEAGASQREHPASETPPPLPEWRVTRDEDRIVVSPEGPPPVRGPIRSIEDRLWSEQRARAAGAPSPALPPAVPPAPAVPEPPAPSAPARPAAASPAPPPSPPAPPPAASAPHEFATLTLARIYESQGYLQKALAIYEELQRRHPEDGEVAARLAALLRRLAAPAAAPAPEPVRPAVSPPPPEPEIPPPARPAPAARAAEAPWRAEPPPLEEPPPVAVPLSAEVEPDLPVEWRLLDAKGVDEPEDSATRLREKTHAVRAQQRARDHTFIGTPPPPPPPAPLPPHEAREEDVSRGHPDFERFLNYVRSLRPPSEP